MLGEVAGFALQEVQDTWCFHSSAGVERDDIAAPKLLHFWIITFEYGKLHFFTVWKLLRNGSLHGFAKVLVAVAILAFTCKAELHGATQSASARFLRLAKGQNMDYGPRGFKFLMVSLLLMCYQLGWVIGTTMQVDKPICTSELVFVCMANGHGCWRRIHSQ